MNKIVREHYPVSQLPEDLRAAIGDAQSVTVTIQAEESAAPIAQQPATSEDWYTRYKHIRRNNYKTTGEVNEWVSSLRDEWSHRER
jgi:hypothetical protein